MPDATPASKPGLKRQLWKRWLLLWPMTAALYFYPINNRFIRITLLLLGIVLIGGLLGFYWQRRRLRLTILTGLVGAGIFLMLPGTFPNPLSLRQRYLNALQSFENTRYVWGGEGKLGIDCSGLLRASLIKAFICEGLQTVNPKAIRLGIELWWNDCSARALGEEYKTLTKRLFEYPALNELQHEQLQPGDLAVTGDGLHVLAYLGDQKWIQAEPNIKKVISLTAPSTNEWFQTPVRLMRWHALEQAPHPH